MGARHGDVLKSSDHWRVLGVPADLLAQFALLPAEVIDTRR